LTPRSLGRRIKVYPLVVLTFGRPKEGGGPSAKETPPAWDRHLSPAAWASESLFVLWLSLHTGVSRGGRPERQGDTSSLGHRTVPAAWVSEFLLLRGGGPNAKETTPASDRNIPPATWASESLLVIWLSLHSSVSRGGRPERQGDTASLEYIDFPRQPGHPNRCCFLLFLYPLASQGRAARAPRR
jgi:hypothetical protein